MKESTKKVNCQMPRTNDINTQIKDERKQSILSAALPLFALYGNKVSVDMICEKAKCSHGLLYHYFRDSDNVLFNIKKSQSFVDLKNKLLQTTDNGSPLDEIYQILQHVNSSISKAKNSDFALLYLILNDEEKLGFKTTLINLIKNGQKVNQIAAGKAEDLASIYIEQNNGVLLKKLLQKSYKIEIIPVDNLMQIFIKKTVR